MENVNKRRRISFSLSKLECGPQEINSREIRLHLSFSANWNKRDKDWKKREFILKLTFSLQLPSSMLKLPMNSNAKIFLAYFVEILLCAVNKVSRRPSVQNLVPSAVNKMQVSSSMCPENDSGNDWRKWSVSIFWLPYGNIWILN